MDFFDYENISATMTFHTESIRKTKEKRLSGTKNIHECKQYFSIPPNIAAQ